MKKTKDEVYRVGIDAHMLGDHSGGNETYYQNILENMEVPKGMEIYVFVKRCADISRINKRFKIVYFGEHSATYRNLIELPWLCLKYKLDLLHVQYFIPFIRPCKVVVTIHDICFEHYKDIFTKKEYIRQKVLIPYAARHSQFVLTDSEFSKKDIQTIYKLPKEKVIVTHCASSKIFQVLNESELNRSELVKKYSLKNRFILTVGNLQPRKNLPRLIEAFELLSKEVEEEIQLVIVGKKAWMYEDILGSVDSSECNIVLTDYIEDVDLVRLYNAADCFVYPSLFEGFGLPVLEAMSCGTPVAVSNVSSLPEVVGDGGMFFDPTSVEDIKNALHKCLFEKEDIAKRNEIALSKVKAYDWKYSAATVTTVYKMMNSK